MNYILEMKKKQINFNRIDEQTAENIMKNEYSFYQLMEYSQLFDQYVSTEKKGQFIRLDFAQIYYLAIIDEQLRHVILQQCLELEKYLKLQITNYFNGRNELISVILQDYMIQDMEYLSETYKESKNDIIHEKYTALKIDELNLVQFLDVIQFGTLERFWIFCYDRCITSSREKLITLRECFISTRYLRNAAAHNNTILSNLPKKAKTEQNCTSSQHVLNYLKQSGVGQKTLATNMSKQIVKDFCNFLYLCKETESSTILQKNDEDWSRFFSDTYNNYADILKSNDLLSSVYRFTRKVQSLLIH